MIKTRAKRKKFSILRSVMDLKEICNELPADDDCYKLISMGEFSSISLICLVAEKCIIHHLYCSTFRVGKKEIIMLNALHKKGRIGNVNFVLYAPLLGDKNGKDNTTRVIETICEKNKWSMEILKNHSKLFLFDTDRGKYVVETSSNLNENPKIEQFSFEKCEESFEFYKKNIFDLGGVN